LAQVAFGLIHPLQNVQHSISDLYWSFSVSFSSRKAQVI
jgi:hypothetical protein